MGVSNIPYTRVPMSFEEKSTWVMAAVTPTSYAVYLSVVMPRLTHTAASQVAYEWPLVASVVAAIVAAIVGHIVITASNPREADLNDERDKMIERSGGYIGSFVLGAGALGALTLTMMQFDHFWIANSLYLTFVLADLTSSVVKLLRYRVGY